MRTPAAWRVRSGRADRVFRRHVAALAAALVVAGCSTLHRGGTPAYVNPANAAMHERAPDRFVVRFETSRGTFDVEAHRDWAPIGADRFYNLARTGYFDDLRFHRVRPRYIAQFGLHRDPAVIAAWKHAFMPDDSVRQSNVRGTIAYAFTTPNTRTTQIYINLVDNGQLDAQGFAPFGIVVRGMDVVDSLYSGYGESAGGGVRAGKQGPIEAEGNAWLDRNFPKLDRIRRAYVLRDQ